MLIDNVEFYIQSEDCPQNSKNWAVIKFHDQVVIPNVCIQPKRRTIGWSGNIITYILIFRYYTYIQNYYKNEGKYLDPNRIILKDYNIVDEFME